ncbi:unnamed protein product [Vitrella brassicaformis CCMP3155]|uniref:Uncharacterized protein n=1 Tax=Vitrella brassicaformis (strain CCMP3155) TaxID=1169540 RepID=A0A0G4FCN5_VITBC|nr:unnamed protein product [Vitrella brassicaformis CCMP3155]|mmetsp:Transcript_38419/g.96247  ORF Transcript_38419/g.96247 Transcript_38419/m.96247 type:complete len:169 (-) Transcript_38419:253-759(-)|eukprot:CEM10995.1 unnamed protein product [Vitrella brassicaformis CCMP3155]
MGASTSRQAQPGLVVTRLEAPGPLLPPSELREADLEHVSMDKLGVEYLSEAPSTSTSGWWRAGTIWGDSSRMLINLVCRDESRPAAKPVNVLFLVVTGPPSSFLSERAMGALLGGRDVPNSMRVRIGDDVIDCHRSHDSFAPVNVLGIAGFRASERMPCPTTRTNRSC